MTTTTDGKQINITSRNTDLPFFPNFTYELFEADKDNKDIPTFTWIQAFFDSTLSVAPELAIFSGSNFEDTNLPILSLVRFAYSGERINIKGRGIFTTGKNIRGQTVKSIGIGTIVTTQFSQVIAYGGMY